MDCEVADVCSITCCSGTNSALSAAPHHEDSVFRFDTRAVALLVVHANSCCTIRLLHCVWHLIVDALCDALMQL